MTSVSGVELERNSLRAREREEEEDTDLSIIALRWKKEPETREFVIDRIPDVWTCNAEEGWCRRFGGTSGSQSGRADKNRLSQKTPLIMEIEMLASEFLRLMNGESK